jgi:hypothetical protein
VLSTALPFAPRAKHCGRTAHTTTVALLAVCTVAGDVMSVGVRRVDHCSDSGVAVVTRRRAPGVVRAA